MLSVINNCFKGHISSKTVGLIPHNLDRVDPNVVLSCGIDIWAAAWDFQQFDILTSVDLEEPKQPPDKLKNSKWCSFSSFKNHRILKRLAKALIRLRVYAGWSEALLVTHTTLFEISCTGSFSDEMPFVIFSACHDMNDPTIKDVCVNGTISNLCKY